MNDYEKNLGFAKEAYKEIMKVFNEYKGKNEGAVYFCWDKCILVDDDLFYESQLQDD